MHTHAFFHRGLEKWVGYPVPGALSLFLPKLKTKHYKLPMKAIFGCPASEKRWLRSMGVISVSGDARSNVFISITEIYIYIFHI